jgi:putative ABC transport system permease protein
LNAFSIAFDSIWSHRTRSALTALGVVIGVFAVVTLTSLGAAVNNYVSGQFSTLGARVITISPAIPKATGTTTGRHGRVRIGGGGGAGFAAADVPSTLTVGDATAIANAHASTIAGAAPIADLPATVSPTLGGSSGIIAIGTTASYFRIEQATFARGRFDGKGAVLGSKAASRLFPGVKNPIGQTLYIDKTALKVAGVLTAGKGLAGDLVDPNVYVPVATGLAATHQSYVSEIVVGAKTNDGVNAAAAAARKVMEKRHPSDNFSVTEATQILSTVQSTLSTITGFLSGLAAISLLVGGIGIMNIMLVTVTERFREIGIRKALGARDGDILVQFLTESVLLAVLGGAIGTAFAAIAAAVITRAIGIPAGLTANAVGLALGFSIAVGAVFGVLPAIRAARLMPADALRTE